MLTKQMWFSLVNIHGYRKALDIAFKYYDVDDIDKIPGIEQTWIENAIQMAPKIEKYETQFFAELRKENANGQTI